MEQRSAEDPSSPRKSPTTDHPASASLRTLLSNLIDYAGLFPPAGLSMRDAVAAYDRHRQSQDAWALGRFVIPVARLSEFAHTAGNLSRRGHPAWSLSALVGDDARRDAAVIAQFNAGNAARFVIDAAEVRVASLDAVSDAVTSLARSLTLFVEIPLNAQLDQYLNALSSARARAKIRTGGVTADAVPSSHDVARFLVACAANALPFKATAGLHHPLRSEYPLTYQLDAKRATMFGFLNVFLAAGLAHAGVGGTEVSSLLEEREPASIHFTSSGVSWRRHELSIDQLTSARQTFALSFGSCSFDEPLGELRARSLL